MCLIFVAIDAHPDYRLVIAAMEWSKESPQINFDSVDARCGIEVIEAARLPG